MAASGRRGKRQSIPERLFGDLESAVRRGRRIAIVLGVLVACFWGGAWFFLSDLPVRLREMTADSALRAAADMGFRVENILVEGKNYTDGEALLALVNVRKGDPIFLFCPDTARELIENMSWVKTARVERRLPDTIYISLIEREPLALFRQGTGLFLIDGEGQILTDRGLDRFGALMMVSGTGAPEHAQELVGMLAAEPAVQQRVDSASRIENRRWNLNFRDGKVVKLPEADMGLALRTLAIAQDEQGLLDKTIKTIDLRDPARMVVRTELGQAMNIRAGAVGGTPL